MADFSTTEDTIYRGRLRLLQPEKGYRFGSDAMLLAGAATARPGQSVLELGCGVGTVLIAAAMRLTDVLFTGIEREAAYATLAQQNVALNDMAARINIVQGDLHDKELFHRLSTFDHVISNPPYYDPGYQTVAPVSLRAVARHDGEGGIAEWLQAANRFLKPKGSITLIYPAQRLAEVLDGLVLFAGEITIFPLWPQKNTASKRLLIRAIKGSKGPLRLLPGLCLHEQDGNLTPKADAVINEGTELDIG